MKRRIALASIGALTAGGWYYWPEDGLTNPCLETSLPDDLAGNDLVATAWDGVDPIRLPGGE